MENENGEDYKVDGKKYLLPSLELVEDVFAKWDSPKEGKYDDQLLILTPVAVRTELQRQHISKEILEYGFEKARKMGFQAVLVEGDPKNYNPRGFRPSHQFGIEAGQNLHLPHPDCLMVKELEAGALERMKGLVDYSFYEALREE